MSVRAVLMAALCLALADVRLPAQGLPAYTVEGTVRDSTGGVIIGAQVRISPDGDVWRSSETDTSGRFSFAALTADRHTIVIAADGFAPLTRTVALGDRAVTSLDVVLQVLITEQIEVTTGGAAGPGLTSSTLTGAALDGLPDDPGAMLMRLRELAGATDSGAPVTVLVDGFRQSIRLPPKQAIQAIRIASNWFAPEFAEPGQARVDIITKPGSSTIHGEMKLNFNDESMNARNALAVRRPAGHVRDVSGYVSGPIVPGRWSFTAYGGHWLQRQYQVVNATVIDPASLVSRSFVEELTAPACIANLWAGTTYQIAPRHTLAVSFSRTTDTADRLGLESGLDLPERSYRRDASDDTARVTATSVPSNRALNEFRIQVTRQRSDTEAASMAPAVIVFDAFNAGGNQSALFTATRHVDVDAADSFTWFSAGHTIKAGVEVRTTARRYTDRTNFGGTFVFGGAFDRGALPVSPLENYRRALAGLPGYGPSQFWITRGDPGVRFHQRSAGGFVQDDWSVTPRVALSYGLRSEWQSVAHGPAFGARAGVALALDASRRQILRAGAGTFFQQIEPELTLDVRRLDGTRQEQVLIDDPPFYPDIPLDLGSASSALATTYGADALLAPRFLIGAVSYERRLAESSFLTVKYGFRQGDHLLRTRNINAPDSHGARPTPLLGPVLQYESTGQLTRHEAGAGWRWDARGRASLFVNYTFARGRSDTDGRTTTPADSRRMDDEMGATAADRPHQMTAGATLTMPARIVASAYVTAASGRAFNITTGFDANGDGVFLDRPALAAPDDPNAIHTAYGAFVLDAPPGAALVARNHGREPAAVRLDLRVSRAFQPSIGASLVLAAAIDNVLNRANFEGVNGVVTSERFGRPNRAATPRRVTVSASVSF